MSEELQAPAEQEPIAQEAPKEPEAKEPEQEAEKPKRRSAREALEKAFSEEPEKKAEEPKAEEKQPEAKDAKEPDKKAKPEEKDAKDAKEPQEDGEKAKKEEPKASKAPSRFSPDAKAEWEKAPASVRAETERAIREMEKGIAEKDATIKPLEPFLKMAKAHNTTLETALANYVGIEQLLRKDPAQGLRQLATNMGWTPQQMIDVLSGKQSEAKDPKDQEILALRQELQAIKGQIGGVQQNMQQQRQETTLASVEKFAAEHERFDELAPEIARMLQTGYATDLKDAYEKADRMNPKPPAPTPEPTPAPPAQTRPARSPQGAPSPGSNPATQRTPSKSPREALQRAFGA